MQAAHLDMPPGSQPGSVSLVVLPAAYVELPKLLCLDGKRKPSCKLFWRSRNLCLPKGHPERPLAIPVGQHAASASGEGCDVLVMFRLGCQPHAVCPLALILLTIGKHLVLQARTHCCTEINHWPARRSHSSGCLSLPQVQEHASWSQSFQISPSHYPIRPGSWLLSPPHRSWSHPAAGRVCPACL